MRLPIPIRSLCARCEIEEINGMLKIFCGDEASRKILDAKKIVIRETLAEFFKMQTPPNLEIEVREAYNKKTEVKTEPAPDDWASFGQEMIGGEEW